MAIEFAGFVFDNAGDAVVGATINLYDKNTTTPVRATTTTGANGDWTISHGTAGEFDIEIVQGSAKRRVKYDEKRQYAEITLGDDNKILFGDTPDAAIVLSDSNTGGGGTFAGEDLVIAVDDASQSLHITDLAAIGTDWALDDTTNPNVYIHSNTTPSTDYLRLGDHDGTTAYIDVVGGTTLAVEIGGTTQMSIAASSLTGNVVGTGASQVAAGDHSHAGGGDLAGPGSSRDEEVIRFDGTTGKLAQSYPTDVGLKVSDTGQVMVQGPLATADDVDLGFGGVGAATYGSGDARFRWSTADTDAHALVLALADANESLHVTNVTNIATDWAVSSTNPTLYIHSNTTPATDYVLIGGHDGTTASIDVAGGTTLNFDIAGTTQMALAASSLTGNVVGTGASQVAAGDHTHPAGGGDVTGPSSSINTAVVRFDGTTGKVIEGPPAGFPTAISDDGDLNCGRHLNVGDDNSVEFGANVDAAISWKTTDTDNHSLSFGLGDSSKALHICDAADMATDWAQDADSDPTVYIHAANDPVTNYIEIRQGTGAAVINTVMDSGFDTLTLQANGVSTWRCNADARCLLGAGTAYGTTSGTNVVQIFDGTAPAGACSQGVGLYANAATNTELYAIDSAGNVDNLTTT